jgi:aspartate racemase
MTDRSPLIAVVGGMGPLASAAFVSTVYARASCAREQELPRLLLWSDPHVTDRTSALLDGRAETLASRLHAAFDACARAGATDYVICCVTAHAVLPLLPARWRTPLVSLVDALLETTVLRRCPQLILSSTGTRRLRVLEQHPRWSAASTWLRWPDEDDQERIHRAIYAVKVRDQAA